MIVQPATFNVPPLMLLISASDCLIGIGIVDVEPSDPAMASLPATILLERVRMTVTPCRIPSPVQIAPPPLTVGIHTVGHRPAHGAVTVNKQWRSPSSARSARHHRPPRPPRRYPDSGVAAR